MSESQKRSLQDLSKSFIEVDRSPKKSKEGSLHESDLNTTPAGQPSPPTPIGMSTPADPNLQLDPSTHGQSSHPQYVTISADDIKRIAEAVREAIKDSLRDEISNMIEEKTEPLRNEIEQLQRDNMNLRRDLDELEQYGRRPLIRLSGIPESSSEDTKAKILDATSKAKIKLSPDEIVNSHRVGHPKRQRAGPRQIIARLNSVDTKFRILRSSKLFQNNVQTKGISVSEDLTKYRDKLLYLCRQLCRNGELKKAWSSNGKISVRDNSDRVHNIRAESDLVPFGHVPPTAES